MGISFCFFFFFFFQMTFVNGGNGVGVHCRTERERVRVLGLCVDMAGVLFSGTFAAQSGTAFALQCLGFLYFSPIITIYHSTSHQQSVAFNFFSFSFLIFALLVHI